MLFLIISGLFNASINEARQANNQAVRYFIAITNLFLRGNVKVASCGIGIHSICNEMASVHLQTNYLPCGVNTAVNLHVGVIMGSLKAHDILLWRVLSNRNEELNKSNGKCLFYAFIILHKKLP